ncbi:hypothetical protein [Deinococcus roseus]|uniref:Uncharacterized protein n=1 Tax=Deinococcus roseus TaxID=392414 RepID=A0ABQ2CYA1_9DEIO|nr:hypothetical protein [Deinococcus roseus]GGJ32743.1 hypothetical protein GCM10008938_18690 [Deinococcus roseus]
MTTKDITTIAIQHLRQFLNQTGNPELPSLEQPLNHLQLAIELLFPEVHLTTPLHVPQVFETAQFSEARAVVQQVLLVLENEPSEAQLRTAQTLLVGVHQQMSGRTGV